MRASQRPGERAVALSLLLAGGLGFASCQMPNQAGGDPTIASGDVGSVSFELTLAGKYQLGQLAYDISGNGFHRAATVDVSGSSSISTVVSGVPVGSGYVAELTAQDTAGKLTPCTGSATFNVTSAATASVPVHMSCSVVQQQTGMGGGEAGSGGAGGASGAGGAGGSPAVPVPRGASYALAALLAGLGAAGLRLRRRS